MWTKSAAVATSNFPPANLTDIAEIHPLFAALYAARVFANRREDKCTSLVV